MTGTDDAARAGSPQALERLIDVVNTNDVQAAQDRLRGPEQTRGWLVAEGFEVGELDRDDWAAMIAFREGVRAAAVANNGYGVDANAVAALRQAIDWLGFTVRATADASLEVASASPAGRILAPLVGALMAAQADGSWARVKACARDSCRWLFYDTTRNRSRTWCTSTTCGSRGRRPSGPTAAGCSRAASLTDHPSAAVDDQAGAHPAPGRWSAVPQPVLRALALGDRGEHRCRPRRCPVS